MIGILMFGGFLLLVTLGAPIAFAMAVPVVVFILVQGEQPLAVIAQQMYTASDSFPLLAIPLFLMAGDLMARARITERLVEFSTRVVGWIRGGLAHVNVLVCMLFAGITGSAIAESVAIGKLLIPAMEREGFDRRDAAALTAAAAIIGPIIPPSIPMVIFGSAMQVSVGALFAAGFIPGILIGLGLMAVSYLRNRRNQLIRRYPFSWARLARATVPAFVPLLTPVILLGGILGGIFTATEAGAVATLYALLAGLLLLRTLSLRDLWESFVYTAKTTCVIMLIVAAANPFSWILSVHHVPQDVAAFLVGVSGSPLVILILMSLLLIVAGMLMETTANILILGPILLPVAVAVGIHPLHFAMAMLVNLIIGGLTPPVGLVLFSTAAVAEIPFERFLWQLCPYLAVEFFVLALILVFPELTLIVPRWLGFI